MLEHNLFDQCSDASRAAAAALCGIFVDLAGFNSALRSIKPLPPGFMVGDVARAYLKATLFELGDFGDTIRVGNFEDSRDQGLLCELLTRRGLHPQLCVNSNGAPRGVAVPQSELSKVRELQGAQPDLFAAS